MLGLMRRMEGWKAWLDKHKNAVVTRIADGIIVFENNLFVTQLLSRWKTTDDK